MLLRRTLVGCLVVMFAACGGATETNLFGTPDLDSGASDDDASPGGDDDDDASLSDGSVEPVLDSGSIADSGVTSSCNPNMANSCPSGSYCNAVGCASSGVCTKIPAEANTASPVCGCNRITYWNASVAGHAGISVKASGECAALGSESCGGGKKCSGGTFCNKQVTKATCGQTIGGTCWGLPSACPTNVFANECGSQKCEKTRCAIIKEERAYYGVDCTP